MKILIADNNTVDQQVLAKKLAAEGYEVLQAEDGAGVMSAVRCHRPDLVLLNTSFPPDVGHGGGAFEDGFQIIEWLRRTEEAAGVRFILITKEDAAKLHDRAKASGVLGLFQKPLDLEALVGVVRQVSDRVPPESGSTDPGPS